MFGLKKYSIIPAKTGIHPTVIPAKAGIHLIHSREGGNPPHPSFPRRRESTIPAHAGIHRPITPTPQHTKKYFVIPAKTGIHPTRHSREGGNPQFPRMREFIDPLPQRPNTRKNTSSFLQKRESTPPVIPAKAGIHNSRVMREFIDPLPQRLNTRKNTSSFLQKRESTPPVIPAKAGIHNSRVCGNSSTHYPNASTHEKILRHS